MQQDEHEPDDAVADQGGEQALEVGRHHHVLHAEPHDGEVADVVWTESCRGRILGVKDSELTLCCWLEPITGWGSSFLINLF